MQGANSVDVDSAAIDASLDVLGARTLELEPEVPPTRPAPEVEGARLAVDWSQALEGAMQLLAKIVAPNWQLTDDEQALLVDQGAKTLEAFFPNFVIEGKWLVLFSFSLCAGGIVGKRFDTDTLTFKPGRVAKLPGPVPMPEPSPARARARSVVAEGLATAGGTDRVVATPWIGHGA